MYWKLRNFWNGLNEIVFVYRHTVVFLILVMVSIILLESNPNQQLVFLRKRVVYASAWIGSRAKDLNPFWGHREADQALRDQNMELAKRNIVLEDAYMENVNLRQLVGFRDRFPMATLPVRIIARDPSPALSTVTLDRGARDGVRMHHNVINAYGLVGQIMELHEDYSICQIMLDKNFRVASKIQRTRFNGVVYWPGNPNEAGFYGVLKNLDVRVGDVILSSEFSEFFLPNFRIGIVQSINNEVEGIFKDIRIQTAVDFNTIEHAFVVIDTAKAVSAVNGFEKYFILRE